ncbi:hypothetical protein ACOMHN_054464 [Nucella lapillus]
MVRYWQCLISEDSHDDDNGAQMEASTSCVDDDNGAQLEASTSCVDDNGAQLEAFPLPPVHRLVRSGFKLCPSV